jgi:hypothetical protein
MEKLKPVLLFATLFGLAAFDMLYGWACREATLVWWTLSDWLPPASC